MFPVLGSEGESNAHNRTIPSALVHENSHSMFQISDLQITMERYDCYTKYFSNLWKNYISAYSKKILKKSQ